MRKETEKKFDEEFGDDYIVSICENAATENELQAIKSFADKHLLDKKEVEELIDYFDNNESDGMPEHITDMPQCWCKPKIKVYSSGNVITHNTGHLSQDIISKLKELL